MSYLLLGEREVKAARKQHRCIWCGQPILVDQPYTYERSIFEGEAQSHHWHPECLGALRAAMGADGCAGDDYSFDAYYEQRPVENGSGGTNE